MKVALLALAVAVFACIGCRGQPPAPDAGEHRAGQVFTTNLTGMNPLCTTGFTEANGIVCKTTPAHVRSAYLYNNSGASAFAVFADSTTIPTSFQNADAGMIGTPVLLPSGNGVVLGTDFFGVDGWLTTQGFAVGISSAGTQGDGGTDAGTFAAAGNYFDITVNGQ